MMKFGLYISISCRQGKEIYESGWKTTVSMAEYSTGWCPGWPGCKPFQKSKYVVCLLPNGIRRILFLTVDNFRNAVKECQWKIQISASVDANWPRNAVCNFHREFLLQSGSGEQVFKMCSHITHGCSLEHKDFVMRTLYGSRRGET